MRVRITAKDVTNRPEAMFDPAPTRQTLSSLLDQKHELMNTPEGRASFSYVYALAWAANAFGSNKSNFGKDDRDNFDNLYHRDFTYNSGVYQYLRLAREEWLRMTWSKHMLDKEEGWKKGFRTLNSLREAVRLHLAPSSG